MDGTCLKLLMIFYYCTSHCHSWASPCASFYSPMWHLLPSYVGKSCMLELLCLTATSCLLPAFMSMCICPSQMLDLAPLVSHLTQEQTWKSVKPCQWVTCSSTESKDRFTLSSRDRLRMLRCLQHCSALLVRWWVSVCLGRDTQKQQKTLQDRQWHPDCGILMK